MEEGVRDTNDGKNEKYDEDKEAECPDDTSPIEVEEVLSDRNDDKNEGIDEGKESECLDDTYPDEMEEGVSDFKNDKSEKMMRKQRLNAYITVPKTVWRNV